MTKKEIATTLAKSLLWIPYVWGGKNPLVGLDCSGFTQFGILAHRSIKILPSSYPLCSHDQWKRLIHFVTPEPSEGCLVFWGKPNRVTHVGYCLNDELCICASGGNSTVDSIAKAYKRGACIKILPINYRRDVVGFVNPFSGGIVL